MPEPRNIGPRGAVLRAAFGTVGLVAAVALLIFQTVRGVRPGWALAAAPLLWLGSLGILQARAKT